MEFLMLKSITMKVKFTLVKEIDGVQRLKYEWPIPGSCLCPKKWKILLLNGYRFCCKYAIKNFLIDKSAFCWSQDVPVFVN